MRINFNVHGHIYTTAIALLYRPIYMSNFVVKGFEPKSLLANGAMKKIIFHEKTNFGSGKNFQKSSLK